MRYEYEATNEKKNGCVNEKSLKKGNYCQEMNNWGTQSSMTINMKYHNNT